MTATTPTNTPVHTGYAAQADLFAQARSIASPLETPPLAQIIAIDLGDGGAKHIVDVHERAFESTGADVMSTILPSTVSQHELNSTIEAANANNSIDGILLLIPVPPQIDFVEALSHIDPTKDIEGVHPAHAVHLLSTSVAFLKLV